MQTTGYKPEITSSIMAPMDERLGFNEGTYYGFDLVIYDQNTVYFHVVPTLYLDNEKNSRVYEFQVHFTFGIENKMQQPTVEFLFEIVNESVKVFRVMQESEQRTKNCYLKPIPDPDFEVLYPDIVQAIMRAFRDK